MADAARQTTIFSQNQNASVSLRPLVATNPLALRQVLQQLSSGSTVDARYIDSARQPNEAEQYELSPTDVQSLLTESVSILGQVANTPEFEAQNFSWKQLQKDGNATASQLQQWSKDMLNVLDGSTLSTSTPEQTQPQQNQPANTQNSGNLPANGVVENLAQQQATEQSQAAPTDQTANVIDLSSTRDLVRWHREIGGSYLMASRTLADRVFDVFLTDQIALIAQSQGNPGVSAQTLREQSPQTYQQLLEQFSFVVESFVRKEIAQNPEAAKFFGSVEGNVLLASKFRAEAISLPSMQSWGFNAQYALSALALGQTVALPPQQVDLATTQASAEEKLNALSSQPPLLPEAKATELQTDATLKQQQQSISALQALPNISPTQIESLKQSMYLAAACGITPSELAHLGTNHWSSVFGLPKPNVSNDDLATILESAGWETHPSTIYPFQVQGIPLSSLPLQNRMLYWMVNQRKAEALQSLDANPQDITQAIAISVQVDPTKTAEFNSYLPETLQGSAPIAQFHASMESVGDDADDADIEAQLFDAYTKLAESRRDRAFRFEREELLRNEWMTQQAVEESDVEQAPVGYISDPAALTAFFSDIQQRSQVYQDLPQASNAPGRGGSLQNAAFNRFGTFLKNKISPKKQVTDAAKNLAGKAATNTVATGLAAIPGAGPVLAGGFKILADKNTRLVAVGAVGAAGAGVFTLLSNVGKFVGSITPSAGGAAASFGSAGAGIKALGGGVGGGSGIAQVGGAGAGGGLGTGLGGAASNLAAAKAAVAKAVMSPAVMAVGGGAGIVGVGTIIVMTSIFHAFLVNSPAATGNDISKYVRIDKVPSPAAPNNKYENPQDLTYSISICAKKGYKITVTGISDTFTVNTNDQEREKAGIPKDPAPAIPTSPVNIDSLKGKLTIDSSDSSQPTEGCVILDPYPIKFDQSYAHSSVKNTVTLNFTAVDGTGTAQSENGQSNLEAIGTAVVCFGKCPTSLAKCWPVTGSITLEPFVPGQQTHAGTDALDIGGATGNPVYTPFNGTAYFYETDTGGIFSEYGNHVFFISEDRSFALVYAHMARLTQTGKGVPVKEGDQLGWVGGTGHLAGDAKKSSVTGPHLHLELRFPGTAFHSFNGFSTKETGQPTMVGPTYAAGVTGGSPRRPSILELMMPKETPNHVDPYGTKVKTCYGN